MKPLSTTLLLGVVTLAGCGHPQVVPPVLATDNAVSVARGNVDWARNAAEREAFPSDEELRLRRALAERLIAEGEYGVARAHVNVLVAARPTWWSNHLALAQIHYYGASLIDDALLDVDACLEIAPTMLPCLTLRAQLLADAERHVDAVAAYDAVLAIQPEAEGVWADVARAQLTLGALDEARAALDHARRTDGESVSLSLLAARVEETAGDLSQAEAHMRWIATHHTDARTGLTYLLRFFERTGQQGPAGAVRAELDALSEPRPTRQLRDL